MAAGAEAPGDVVGPADDVVRKIGVRQVRLGRAFGQVSAAHARKGVRDAGGRQRDR